MKGVLSVIVAALLVGGSALAQGDGPRPSRRGGNREREPGGGPRGAMLERVLQNAELIKQVGLSEDQVETLKTAMFKAKEQEIKLRAEVELVGLKQAKLMMQDDVDENAVLVAVEEKWKIKAELAKIPIRQMLLLKKTLTAEQRLKMEAVVRERMRSRMRGRMQQDRNSNREGGPRPEGRFGGRRRDGADEPRPDGERSRD